jgi:hypothetical protein
MFHVERLAGFNTYGSYRSAAHWSRYNPLQAVRWISGVFCGYFCETRSEMREKWAHSLWEAIEKEDPEQGVWQRNGTATGWKLLFRGEKGDLATRGHAYSGGRESGFHVVHGA